QRYGAGCPGGDVRHVGALVVYLDRERVGRKEALLVDEGYPERRRRHGEDVARLLHRYLDSGEVDHRQYPRGDDEAHHYAEGEIKEVVARVDRGKTHKEAYDEEPHALSRRASTG